jgi:hypothetical protein
MSQSSNRAPAAARYDARMKTIVAAFALTATLASAEPTPRVASLDWLTGTWTVSRGDEIVMESWLGPGNGVMVAVNLTTRGSSRKTFEFLRIADTPEGFSCFASPGGRPPTEFKLKEQRERRVVFENAAHDFPQRILYWRDGDALVARIEGTIGGAQKSQEWRFSRLR